MTERPLTDFDDRLRRAREARGISLRQVSSVTRISVRALEALERNDLSRLPGGIFTRSFVRAYAVEVGLDPEKTLHEFLEQCPPDRASAEPVVRPQEALWRERLNVRHVAQALLLFVLLVAAAIASARWYNTGRSTIRNSDGSVVQPERGVAPRAPASIAERTGSQGRAATRTGISGAVPTAGTIEPANLSLAAVARAACWISVTTDEGRSTQRLLAPGERFAATAQRSFRVRVGNAGALALTLNGHPARPLGTSGQVVTVRISLDNLHTFLTP
jgi:cytoskeleton protein RodZ